MSKHWLEIENFSDKETTAMFDAICTEVLGKSPIDVKKGLLGMKSAKKDTKVTLSHLMTLIDHAKIEFSFKVTYLKEDKPEIPPAPKLEVGLKVDPVNEAMEEQKKEIIPVQARQEETGKGVQRNFQEVGATGPVKPVSSDKPSEEGKAPVFDPGAIPNFKI